MTATIGAVGFADFGSSKVKQAAVLFDELYAMSVDVHGDGRVVERLQEYGIVSTVVSYMDFPRADGTWRIDSEYLAYLRGLPPRGGRHPVYEFSDLMARVLRFVAEQSESGSTAVPVLLSAALPNDAKSRRHDVLQLILKALPLPTEETPWEAVRDWRSDADAKAKYSRLRVWIDRACRGPLDINEIEHELAALLADYATYMRLQHKKFDRSALEVFCVTTAEILEDAVRLRFSKAVERLFSVSRDEISLLQAELDAPGRELAYIAATRERFRA